MKKIISSSASVGMLCSVLFASGCAISSGGGDNTIERLDVALPKQINWSQSPAKKMDGGGLSQEWVIKGFKSNNTPSRVIYQKIVPAVDSTKLMGQVLAPFKRSCKDITFTKVQMKTKYSDKLATGMICSQLGKNPVGLIAYTSVISDTSASHMVIGEVRTLPSDKAGQLAIKNEQQRKQAQTSAAIADLLHTMVTEIKVCDSGNNCK